MTTKIIKFNDGSTTYVPVTVASAVQYDTGAGAPMSVQDAIGTVAQSLIDIANNANGSYMSVSGATDPTVKILTPNGTEKSSYQFKGSGSGTGSSTGHVTVSYANGVITFGTTYNNYYNKITDKGLSGYQIAEITDNGTGSSTKLYVPKATSSHLGVVQLGYADANKGYALKLDSSGKGYVNVPWTDTVPDYSNTYAPKSHVDVKASTTAYGHVIVDSVLNAASENPVQNKAINTALGGKANSTHTHNITWSGTNYAPADSVSTVNVLTYFNSSSTSLNNDGTASYTTVTVPTTHYVNTKVADMAKALKYQGTISAGATAFPTGAQKGDVYVFAGASTINEVTYEKGDMAIYDGTEWTVVNANWTASDGSSSVTVGGSKVTLASIGGVDIDIQVTQEANVAHMSDFSSYVKTISSNPTTSPTGVITSAVKTGQDIKFTYTNVSSKGTATAATTLSSTAKTIIPGWEQNSYGKITSVTGVSIKQDHEGTGAAGKLTYWNSTTSHTAVTTSYGNSTTKYAYVENGVLKEGNLPTFTNSNDFSVIAAGTDATGVTAGTVNKNSATADKVGDTLTVQGGNKWITTGASDTSSADTLFINHALKGNGGTAALKKIAWDEAGHIGASADVTITKNLKYDVYPCAVEFTLSIGDAESTGNTIVTNIS